jgi:hypothetical protein
MGYGGYPGIGIHTEESTRNNVIVECVLIHSAHKGKKEFVSAASFQRLSSHTD